MTKARLGLAILSVGIIAGSVGAVAADKASKPSLNNTISVEFGPEYKTTDSSWADDYIKLGYSHLFDNNFVMGSSFQYSLRSDATSIDQVEASLGYKFKSGPLTLTPSAILGYGFGDQPKINPAKGHGSDPDGYYAVSLAADLKLDDHWTWNVVNARYRNAFDYTWITPKVSTGVTYKFDAADAIYANVGYAWKDKGDGKDLLSDKWNVAIGYKFSF